MHRSRAAVATLLLCFGLLATACAGPRPTVTSIDIEPLVATTAPTTSVLAPPPPPTTAQPVVNVATAAKNSAVDLAVVATALNDAVEIFHDPSEANRQRIIDRPAQSASLVFLVDQTAEPTDGWHKVLLPVRPNGSTGWIRANEVSLARHNYRVDVSLSDYELRVFDGGQLRFQATIAVAAENSPTPGGEYYITELLQPTEPDSVYGSFAYGLSGFSETFETFNGGPGQLGIHGTNDPDAIGSQASAGCVRLANGDVAHLVEFLPLGTPVRILA